MDSEASNAAANIVVECRCGAVAVKISGEPVTQFYCHCDDCQIVHGAAYVPIVMYRATAVSVVRGEPSGWKLRTTVRHTCSVCGTRLFADPDPRVRAVTAYLLPPGLFRPLFHIRCRHALLPVKDALPHYADLPTFMGGSGETVDW